MKSALFLALASFVACGGRVVEDGSSAGSSSAESSLAGSSSAGQTGDPASGAGRSSSPSDPFPTHVLGDCTPGFLQSANPQRACHWLTDDGVCFDDREAACACICPRDMKSVCFGPSDRGPNSATKVSCQ